MCCMPSFHGKRLGILTGHESIDHTMVHKDKLTWLSPQMSFASEIGNYSICYSVQIYCNFPNACKHSSIITPFPGKMLRLIQSFNLSQFHGYLTLGFTVMHVFNSSRQVLMIECVQQISHQENQLWSGQSSVKWPSETCAPIIHSYPHVKQGLYTESWESGLSEWNTVLYVITHSTIQ